MDIRKLQRAIVDGLEDVKAQNIAVFNTEHLSSMFERVIIASGTSNRQTKALASSVRESVKSRGMQVMATEGEDNGEWIIVDCGAAVAHIMQPAIRDYYHLEEIWGGKNVRIKLGDAKTTLVKASEPEPPPRASRSPKATQAAATPKGGGSRGTRLATGKAAPAADSAAPKKPATRRTPAKPAGMERPSAGKKLAAKPAIPRTAAARKAPARKAPARKSTPR
jgi:ribosome-associated protein